MTKWARIRIRGGGRPARAGLESAGLGVDPTDFVGTPAAERARVAREADDAAALVAQATRAQADLLRRLANAYPSRGVCFPFVATLRRFLAATAALDERAGAALDEAAIARLWREAAEATEEPLD